MLPFLSEFHVKCRDTKMTGTAMEEEYDIVEVEFEERDRLKPIFLPYEVIPTHQWGTTKQITRS
jgi:hypothetical protein